MCKRSFDFSLALLGLMLAWPVMGLIALLVYLDAPGPVIFSQSRLGRGGVPFRMHKFRKFPPDWGTKGAGVTTQGDVRMTGIGAILERTKLDELPQLWNIIRGEMSFVGPRPESLRYADLFTGPYQAVLTVLPGIFGPNQVAYRNESALYPTEGDPEIFYRTVLFPQKAQADMDYFINKSSCLKDIYWLFYGVWISVVGVVHWQRFAGMHGRILLMDLLALELAWLAAFVLRLGGNFSTLYHGDVYWLGTILLPLITLPLMMVGGGYRHPVRMFAMIDVFRLTQLVTLGFLLVAWLELGFFYRNMAISVGIIAWLLALPAMIIPRVMKREQWRRGHRSTIHPSGKHHTILIYGAGRRGMALATLINMSFSNVQIVGFVDDDEQLRGRFIAGIKVLGSERDLNTLLELETIDQLWVSAILAPNKYHRLEEWAETQQIKWVDFRKIHEFAEFI